MNLKNPVTLIRGLLLLMVLSTAISLAGLFYRPLPHVYFLDGAGYPAPPLEENPAMRAKVAATLIARALADARTSFVTQQATAITSEWAAHVLGNGALAALPRITGPQVVTVTHAELSPDQTSANVNWTESTTTLKRSFTATLAITFSDEWRSLQNPIGVVVTRVSDHQIFLDTLELSK